MPTLADLTLFPFPADGGQPERIAQTFATDVVVKRNGAERRAAWREVPARRYEFTAAFDNGRDAMRFRALWQAAAEPGRFIVPLWPRYSVVTAIAGAVVTADTRNRTAVAGGPGLQAGARALVWDSPTNCEVVEIDSVTDGAITTVDPVAGSYRPGAVRVVPVMNAWLVPPTVDKQGVAGELVPVVFVEEFTGVAGIDPDVGAGADVAAVAIALDTRRYGSLQAGRKFATAYARAYDQTGQRIPRPNIVWTIVLTTGSPPDLLDPPTRYSEVDDGQGFNLEWTGGVGTYFEITATIGAVSQIVRYQ